MIDHESTDLDGAARLARDAAFEVGLDEAVEDEYRLPCGCYEYHTADCPRLTDRFSDDGGWDGDDYHDDYPF